MNYYISDLHFGHKNVLKFDNRPFETIEEMEEVLIHNWNNAVGKQDNVFICGDFIWGKGNEWLRIVPKLNGNKTLVRGNHCLKKDSMSKTLKNMFTDIVDYKEITDNGKHVILCHYPILLYKSSYNPNVYMLCGHVHQTKENDFLNTWRKELKLTKTSNSDNCGNIYNVGCMMPYMNYTPRTLEGIIEGNKQ